MAVIFPVGTVVESSDLVGRTEVVGSLVKRLHRGENLTLSAPRRTGKTSVAKQVLVELQDAGAMVSYLDVFRYSSPDRLALGFAEAILANDQALNKGVRWLGEHLPHLSEIRTDFGEAVHLAVKLEQNKRLELEEVLDLGESLAKRRKRPLVVVIDEFQDARKFGSGIYRTLRSFFQHHSHTAYLFLGSQKGLLETLFVRENEPFFRFASLEPLPQVPAEVWAPYLQGKLRTVGIDVSEAFTLRLAELAGNHPGDLMHLGSAVLDVWNPGVEASASLAAAYRVAMARLEPAFAGMWRLLEGIPFGQVIARRVAAGEPIHSGRKMPPSPYQVTRALRYLADEGFLEKVDRGRYRFFEQMFADYVRSMDP